MNCGSVFRVRIGTSLWHIGWSGVDGPTDGTAIDHIAFSYTDIKPVFQQMQRSGVNIVHPIVKSAEYGLTSFFVRGPDGLLVEVVQEPPIPEGIWR